VRYGTPVGLKGYAMQDGDVVEFRFDILFTGQLLNRPAAGAGA